MGVSKTIRAALGALCVMTSYNVFHTLLWDAVTMSAVCRHAHVTWSYVSLCPHSGIRQPGSSVWFVR
eukprot:2032920-Rhodomonas_salina.1